MLRHDPTIALAPIDGFETPDGTILASERGERAQLRFPYAIRQHRSLDLGGR